MNVFCKRYVSLSCFTYMHEHFENHVLYKFQHNTYVGKFMKEFTSHGFWKFSSISSSYVWIHSTQEVEKCSKEWVYKMCICTFGRNIWPINWGDCDTDHYLVVAKIKERLAVSKQTLQRVHMEMFNLKKWNEVEGKEQYRVEISNRFTALEILHTEVDINRGWKTIRQDIKGDWIR
jgi:hypothetical protein